MLALTVRFTEAQKVRTMPASRKKAYQLACTVVEKTVITDTLKHRFVIEKEFARGGFGRIYSGKQEDSKEYGKSGSLAIKVEPYANGPLFTEITVFQRILTPQKLETWMDKKKVSHIGLPSYVSSGLFTHNGEKLRFLIMPRYEKSLESYRIANGGVLDMPLVLTVAKQCVDCLSYMQDHDYVHGDLKADNILLASANEYSRCFLVDFGLARLAKGNVDKPDKKRAHNGTLLFTSLDAHRGCAPSFRGDLEILGYNILYWLCGTLPWEKCAQKPEAVMVEKEKFSKELQKNIKMLVNDEYVSFLSKLFKLAYETPYLSKIDYENVQLIFNGIKTPLLSRKSLKSKKSGEKENSKASLAGENGKAGNVSPLTSRKREGSAEELGKVLKSELKNIAGAGASSSISSSKSLVPIRKRGRFTNQLSKKANKSPKIAKENCPEVDSNNDNKEKDVERQSGVISNKNNVKKIKPKSRVGLKSLAKQDTASSSALSRSSKKLDLDDSTSKKLRNVIPGLRNMKNVRRSLKDVLVKKYINVANQANKK
ncbi:unnamed protein product [Litomosoides sigmodontis]|uniref:non-specific serine/threonine protein kinase n=1 Tax=Litomosoides sigmodontis TaxID=42156 RepID=A0A3P6SNP9_LITSI|nr:unnamed protein product [Litomosoides sigmodontis]